MTTTGYRRFQMAQASECPIALFDIALAKPGTYGIDASTPWEPDVTSYFLGSSIRVVQRRSQSVAVRDEWEPA